MRDVLVLRHGEWDLEHDQLTVKGAEVARVLRERIGGEFVVVVSSPARRTRETAEIVGGKKPVEDSRAASLKATPEQGRRMLETRKNHPLGAAGAIFSIPELIPLVRAKGEELVDLIKETIGGLDDDRRALIVSHDGTMAAAEKVLKGESFDFLTMTYGELEGYYIDENMQLTQFRKEN